MHSIRRWLLLSLLGIVLAGVAGAGGLIYRQTRAEANELFDFQMKQMAAALPSEPFSSVLGSNSPADGLVIQIWSRNGVQLYYSHPRATLAPRAELGFSTERNPSGVWRVYSAIVGDNVVQIAQPLSVRDGLAASVAWRTIWPLLVLLPLLGVLVWVIVGHGLRPLSRVTQAIDARRPDVLDPLSEQGVPFEVKPLVHARNGLLTRLGQALDTQKAFVADAAHELRTPLAALRLQLQVLERAADEPERQDALGDLRAGVTRATRLVEQLLLLARAEPAYTPLSGEQPLQPVDLAALVSERVAAYAALALDKQIDLGIEQAQPARVAGDAETLQLLFGNLLDNAIKYTPRHGRIDVSIDAPAPTTPNDDAAPRTVCVEIVDNGPGIAPADRERVFDRFYRAAAARGETSGSGLGLAIVARVAEHHAARVELDDAPSGPGLRVRVFFDALPG